MSMRLFKVRVQPVFLSEQDREQTANVLDIPAADWKAVVADGGPFDQEIARLIGEATSTDASGVTGSAVPVPPLPDSPPPAPSSASGDSRSVASPEAPPASADAASPSSAIAEASDQLG